MKRSLFAIAAFGLILLTGACASFCCTKPTAEKFTVNNVYGDHMVLQRQKPIQIVGTAEAGKSVKVTLGDNSVVAEACKGGVWKAVLPAMEAGGPYTVTVSGAKGSKPIVFKDVLIGEVWFCSGQSNMQMPVVGGKFWCSQNGHAEAAAAKYPNIRIFQVSRVVSPGVEKNVIKSTYGWEVCTPKTIGKFSACGFYFGRELHKELNIPIGLIDSSWGGTRIEPWISEKGYIDGKRSNELLRIKSAREQNYEQKMREIEAKLEKTVDAWISKFYTTYAKETAAAKEWAMPATDTASWRSVVLPEYSFYDLGVFWFRYAVDVPADWAGKELKLSLGAIDDLDETFFNGKEIGRTTLKEMDYWSKKRIYVIPGKLVKAGKNIIAIRVSNLYFSGGFSADSSMTLANKSAKINLAGKWLMKPEFVADVRIVGARPSFEPLEVGSSQFPATLYNAMVKPFTVYPMRGFIWYQGCSNSGNPPDYMNLHPLLIQDWRNRWNDQTMPFIFAQLAAFHGHKPKNRFSEEYLKKLAPGNSGYAELREVQTATLKVPLTGMGVAIDIGDHSDIHPANKQELAYRMAQEAKRLVYGYKGVTSGPMFKSMKVENGKVRIEFTNTGKGLKVKGDKLNCFAIAGKDGKFVWANAKVDGNSVVVWSEKVKEPAHVRYAWAGFPVDPNLYNQEGFPACPFRTDAPDYLLK
ncbi:MAG: 9-O-acetylesterase [Lentisphaeria bacterium]|nr:9-O-acetylesterase [Lentisphaeria bacterium]